MIAIGCDGAYRPRAGCAWCQRLQWSSARLSSSARGEHYAQLQGSARVRFIQESSSTKGRSSVCGSCRLVPNQVRNRNSLWHGTAEDQLYEELTLPMKWYASPEAIDEVHGFQRWER